ncbi:MAG: HAD hydrolase-like protein [Cyclobacteriaceae bacterium]|nr:HAD hydrolase-like protein [Cyclobacteriaceae bacterium]
MKYALVIFDLAGTTVSDNNDVARILAQTLKNFGVMVTMEEANALMGIPKPKAIRELLTAKKQFRLMDDNTVELIHQAFRTSMIGFYRNDPDVKETTGATEIFELLKSQGLKIAVDTGFDRLITDVLLERMGWLRKGLVDVSVTTDEVCNGRPHPDMIFEAMKRTGITDARQVVKVGDTPADLQEGAAAACGCVIGVTGGATSFDVLKRYPHHFIEDSLRGVYRRITEI